MRKGSFILTAVATVIAMAFNSLPSAGSEGHWIRKLVLKRLEKMREGKIDMPLLHAQQASSLNYIYYRPYANKGRVAVTLPDENEVVRFRKIREGVSSEALDYLDEFYGRRDDLKALAVRDSDVDGVPDYRVSDFFGKFMEGDIDIDGDGVRNILDSHPFDSRLGGKETNGDGIPDADFADRNANGLPDHIDWSLHKDNRPLADIQLGLFRDHKIVLVERNAEFDLALATAIDDAVRRVFRGYFEKKGVLPTLRTIAVEKTALLGALAALVAEDNTSAQVFSQTQSLIVYDVGRKVGDDIGLIGLLAHEMGHSYHMSLDFDAGEIDMENRRTDFPVPHFVELIERFEWTQSGYYKGALEDSLPLSPQFVYVGMSEPEFLLKGRTPDEWHDWLNGIYEHVNETPDYLEHPSFAKEEVVSDYSLSTPYEWYGDNMLAYLFYVLEQEALERQSSPGDDNERDAAVAATQQRITEASRAIWPAFYHRNIGKDVIAYFEAAFPIAENDREALVGRYIEPLLQPTSQR